MKTWEQTSRSTRNKKIGLAWGSSIISKIATLGSQAVAVPLVYHTLGQTQYAAYAAVTASAGLVSALNLGIGGSLVTPLACAAAEGDRVKEAMLFRSGIIPLTALSLLAIAIAIPVAANTPLILLFGRIGAVDSIDLRTATLIAAAAAAVAIPLSSVDSLRQAYQELHIGNLVGAGAGLAMCVSLIVAARSTNRLPIFVAIFVLVPILGKILNSILLLCRRPYLMSRTGGGMLAYTRTLLGDGVRYIASSLAYVLVYQWPVYYVARTLDPQISSTFAITIQAAVLPVSFMVGLIQPLWSAMANAHTEKDHIWQRMLLKHGRRVICSAGVLVFLSLACFGEPLLRIWMRKPIALPLSIRICIGSYVLLALFEYYHFVLALGVGHLRKGATAVFKRSIVFALSVPILLGVGGVQGIWIGLCLSAIWSSWQLTRIVRVSVNS